MSYCRFENTSHDLQDCVDALDTILCGGGENEYGDTLSDTEEYYAKRMYEQAKEYVDNYEQYMFLKENTK